MALDIFCILIDGKYFLFLDEVKMRDWVDEKGLFVVVFFSRKHGKVFLISQTSTQLCSTMAVTLFSYSRLFSWYSCAAWLLAGLLGLGSSSRDWMEVSIEETSYVGLQRF